MAYDPNRTIVVGGHPQAYGPNGEMLMLTTLPSAAVANIAALKAIPAASKQDGATYVLQDSGPRWRYVAASVLTGDDFLVSTPTDTLGRFFRVDTDIDITAAATFATADGATLYTVPTGFQLAIAVPYWHVTTSWTGGTSSAIGLASSNTGLSTAGDLLGGASGDVAAGLLSTGAYAKGTAGAKIGKPGAVLVGGDTVTFEQITSTFTAGAAVVHVPVRVLLVPAA